MPARVRFIGNVTQNLIFGSAKYLGQQSFEAFVFRSALDEFRPPGYQIVDGSASTRLWVVLPPPDLSIIRSRVFRKYRLMSLIDWARYCLLPVIV